MKTWHFLNLLFLLCISMNVFANSGRLYPWGSDDALIYQGKIIEAKLLIDDPKFFTIEDFNSANRENFSEIFYYLESTAITDQQYKLRLVLKKSINSDTPIAFYVSNKKIEVKLLDFHFVEKKDLLKDYIIQDQRLGWKYYFSQEIVLLLIISLSLLGIGASYFLRKYFLKNKAQKQLALRKDYWKSYFYSAQTREEFEDIGKRKSEWLNLLKGQPEPCLKYLKILEEHQYKKEISESELKEIKQALNGMKDVIERFGI